MLRRYARLLLSPVFPLSLASKLAVIPDGSYASMLEVLALPSTFDWMSQIWMDIGIHPLDVTGVACSFFSPSTQLLNLPLLRLKCSP